MYIYICIDMIHIYSMIATIISIYIYTIHISDKYEMYICDSYELQALREGAWRSP